MSAYPAYETVANLVVIVASELRKYTTAYDEGEFYGTHAEIPQVRALIDQAQEIEKDEFHDLTTIQTWLLDVAIIGPSLWD